MEEGNKIIKIKSLYIGLIVSLIGLLIFVLIFRNIDSFVSYLLGSLSSIIGFIILIKSVNNTQNLKNRMIVSYFIRYLLYFIFLGIVALLFDDKYLFVALGGIIIFKASQIIYCLIVGGEAI